jgi:hypothetical protein
VDRWTCSGNRLSSVPPVQGISEVQMSDLQTYLNWVFTGCGVIFTAIVVPHFRKVHRLETELAVIERDSSYTRRTLGELKHELELLRKGQSKIESRLAVIEAKLD